jgi:hypothetical protein
MVVVVMVMVCRLSELIDDMYVWSTQEKWEMISGFFHISVEIVIPGNSEWFQLYTAAESAMCRPEILIYVDDMSELRVELN